MEIIAEQIIDGALIGLAISAVAWITYVSIRLEADKSDSAETRIEQMYQAIWNGHPKDRLYAWYRLRESLRNMLHDEEWDVDLLLYHVDERIRQESKLQRLQRVDLSDLTVDEHGDLIGGKL